MTFGPDSTGSLPVLTQLMANFHLHEPLPWTSDQSLTEDAIQNAFAAFFKGLSVLQNAASDVEIVQMAFEGNLTKLLKAIREPYSSTIVKLNKRISDLREGKEQEIADLRDEIVQLRDAKDHLRDTKDELRAEKDQELSELRAEKDQELSELRTEKDQQLSELRTEKDQQLSELRDKNENLRNLKDEEIAKLANEKERIIDQMQAIQMANLKRVAAIETISATVTITELWDQVLNDQNTDLNEILPVIEIARQVKDTEISATVNASYEDEYAMYGPILSCLAAYLTTPRSEHHPGSRVWDTHTKRNLEKRSPDMTITTQDVPDADAHSIIAVWEIKHGVLIKRDFGQLYGYLQLLGRTQPYRRNFVGVLSNLTKNVVLHYTSPLGEDPSSCRVFNSVTTAYAISYLREYILRDRSYHPAIPAFPISIGPMYRRLGNPLLNVIAAFKVPDNLQDNYFRRGKWINTEVNTAQFMVVKRTLPATRDRAARSVANEIKMLRFITSEGGHQSLPKLVYHGNDCQEFGITPYGCPVRSGNIGIQWDTALTDVLAALEWLHDHQIIHRDVRWDNIIWDGRHAILIDLGESIFVTDGMDPVMYGGGAICCPPSLIGSFQVPYIPAPADDCHAFIQLISMLLWPAFWVGIKSMNVGTPHAREARKLSQFWNNIAASSYYSPYLVAAKDANYKILRGMVELCVYF